MVLLIARGQRRIKHGVFCKYVLGMKGGRFVRNNRMYAEVPDSEHYDGERNIGMISFQSQSQAY